MLKNRIAKYRKPLTIVLACFLGIAFVTLLILPADYFDTGQATCLSVIFFDLECYGCGMTRAIQHLLHLDFSSAYEFNKLSFIVLPLAVWMIAKELYKNIFSKEAENKS
jgi:Protein of unknown function (DUF2752)